MVNKAEVGRFDGTYQVVAFNDGDKISALLTKAGITLSEGEGVNSDSGEDVSISDVAIDGETYSIVGNYKQGNDEAEPETEEPEAEEPEAD